MKYLVLSLCFNLFLIASCRQKPPEIQWDADFGGNDADQLYSIVEANNDGFLLAGSSYSSSNGDRSDPNRGLWNDYWIVRIDSNGNKMWDKAYGGNDQDYFRDAIKCHDGGYLLCGMSFSYKGSDKTENNEGRIDVWIVKVDFNGVKQWDRCYGGTGDEGIATAVLTADNGFAIGCSSNSSIGGDKSDSSRGADYWIAKIDSAGNKIWDKTFGGNGSDQIYGIVDAVDGMVISGASNSDSSGDKSEKSYGGWDCWLVKTDQEGNKIWDKTFGAGGDQICTCLVRDGEGGYVLGGFTNNTDQKNGGALNDYWIVKIDSGGNVLWEKTFGGNGDDGLYSIALAHDGGYVFAGVSNSPVSGDKSQPAHGSYDYWILKTDNLGNKLWDMTIGGYSDEIGANLGNSHMDILVTRDGSYLVGGQSRSGISGEKTKPNKGAEDYWVVQLKGE